MLIKLIKLECGSTLFICTHFRFVYVLRSVALNPPEYCSLWDSRSSFPYLLFVRLLRCLLLGNASGINTNFGFCHDLLKIVDSARKTILRKLHCNQWSEVVNILFALWQYYLLWPTSLEQGKITSVKTSKIICTFGEIERI